MTNNQEKKNPQQKYEEFLRLINILQFRNVVISPKQEKEINEEYVKLKREAYLFHTRNKR